MKLILAVLLTLALTWGCNANADDTETFPEQIAVNPQNGDINVKETQNRSEGVREMRSATEHTDPWAVRLSRAQSKEVDPPPFWATRGRREMEELLEAIQAANKADEDKREGKTSVENLPPFWANRGRREGFPNANDVLKAIMSNNGRQDLHSMSVLQALWQNKNKNKSLDSLLGNIPRNLNKTMIGSIKTAEDRARFWANRQRREGSLEVTGPFWANRGRREEEEDEARFWANRGRDVDEHGPFWANRGRDVSEDEPFWANRGRDVDDQGPFWANRGRDVNEEGPFWANRGRDVTEHGPFWANRGRDVDEEGPFWANRGRNVPEQDAYIAKREDNAKGDSHGKMNIQSRLFVEEPTWIPLERRQVVPEGLGMQNDPFWISRGRRREQDPRVRRGLRGSLSGEEPFYPSRGRRGLKDSLSTEEPFWAVRGRRGLLDSLSQEEPFWAVRGKKTARLQDLWRARRVPSGASATRAIGVLQDPNFWPVRGKRNQDSDNEEDDKFWDTLEKKSAAKSSQQ